jgi:putative N6-adenine-specific DNA methylase
MDLKATTNQAEWRPMHATCDAGLEPMLAAELTALGAADVTPGPRVVAFRGDRNLLWRANLTCRVANRILLPIAEFPARDRDQLFRGARRMDWGQYLSTRQSIAVDARTAQSRLDQPALVADVVKDAIVGRARDATGRSPRVDRRNPDVPIHVHVAGDHCTVSLDSSGARLHRRGYRPEPGPAPLRETLAAGILALAGWEGEEPLLDPLCGSGTLVIEAALRSRRFAPGLLRLGPGGEGFAFQRWRGHEREAFRRLAHIVRAAARPAIAAPIHGADVDAEALEQARRGCQRAGVTTDVRLERRPVAEAMPGEERGVIVTHPPFGERLSDPIAAADLYAELGEMLRRFAGHTAWVLLGDPDLARHIGLRAAESLTVFNGPLECRLLRFDLQAGPTAG